MLTDFDYIGSDGIEYATEAEALEAEKQKADPARAARPPLFLYKFIITRK